VSKPDPQTTDPRYPIAVVPTPLRIGLEAFAYRAGVAPELVRRFVALGLLDARRDTRGALWFGPSQLADLARIRRLRVGLQLNYAGLGLVIDLLDRIQRLEDALRTQRAVRSQPPWT
jgi:chaperone modulatory protein CbpM